jgi:hypothetical protein
MFHSNTKLTGLLLKERLAQSATLFRSAAYKLECGPERERLIAKAHQAEVAIQLDKWLSTPGLRAPV